MIDHLNSHDHLHPNGLNINKIGMKYSSNQPCICESVMESSEYFGPYHDSSFPILVGSDKKMQFDSLNSGPCYLPLYKRNLWHFDCDTGARRKL